MITTTQIVNTACAEFNGTRICYPSAIIDLKAPMCNYLDVEEVRGNDTDRRAICIGENSIPGVTPITLNCGNGENITRVADSGGNLVEICHYTSVSQANRAKVSCSVGNDLVNSDCIRSAMSCDLDSDTEIAIISEDEDQGEVEYTCSTRNNQEASISIDCGN